jgi:tetratricopeptide (TPR) repeat protein
LIISALGIVIYQFAKGPTGSVPVEYVPVQMRVMNAFYSLFWYIKQTIFPGDLIPLYQLNRDLDYYSGIYLFSAFLVGLVTIVCLWRAYKGERLWASAWFFYLFTIFPALGLYMVFRHSMADRYTYLPTLSFWVLFGLALRILWQKVIQIRGARLFKTALVASLCLLALAYGMRTRAQITVWENSSNLWMHVIEKSEYVPALAYFALGWAYHEKGDLDTVLKYYKIAHTLNPKNPKYLSGIAGVYIDQKQYEKAVEICRRAVALRPNEPLYHAQLGQALAILERYEEAEEHLLKALELDENFHFAHIYLTILYKETGREEKAREHYRLFKKLEGELGRDIVSSLGIASEGEDIVTAE